MIASKKKNVYYIILLHYVSSGENVLYVSVYSLYYSILVSGYFFSSILYASQPRSADWHVSARTRRTNRTKREEMRKKMNTNNKRRHGH